MTPTEATRTMYDFAMRGAWDSVAAFMADDFVIHEPHSLPYGGEWRGRDALQRLFTQVMGLWEAPEVEWLDLFGNDTHVVALLRFGMTAPGTGKRIVQRVAEVTSFNDAGLMTEMHIHYFDTAELVEALGA